MDESGILLTIQKHKCAFMTFPLQKGRIVQDAELMGKIQIGREGKGALF